MIRELFSKIWNKYVIKLIIIAFSEKNSVNCYYYGVCGSVNNKKQLDQCSGRQLLANYVRRLMMSDEIVYKQGSHYVTTL